MKRTLTILFLLTLPVLVAVSQSMIPVGQYIPVGQQLTTVPSAGGGGSTCTFYANLSTGYFQRNAIAIPSVAFTPTATVTICEVVWTPGDGINSTTSHTEIRTASNGGGSLLATSSSVTPVAWTEETNTFSSPLTVTGGTTVYITRVANGTDNMRLDTPASQTGFTAVSYDGSSLVSVAHGDFCYSLEIHTMQ